MPVLERRIVKTYKPLKLMSVFMFTFGYQGVGGVPIIEQVIEQ